MPLYGQLKEHVSYSELRLFNECQWKWLNSKILGNQVEERSFQMDFGKAVHAGMEILYAKDGTAEAATELAEKMYNESLSTLKDLHPSDLKEANRIKSCIKSFYDDCLKCPELQGIVSLKSELKLLDDIARNDGLSIKFKGFIDIVFIKKLKRKTVIYIADFKTCQWGWPAEKFRDINVISQLLLYKHFFCKLLEADPKNVSLAFILLKKKPKVGDLTVSVEKISAGPKATEQALNYLQNTITDMHSYSYSKNFEVCKKVWIDSETKEERSAQCQFYGTALCSESEQKP